MKKRARIKRIISTFVKYDGINFLLALIILLFLILRFRVWEDTEVAIVDLTIFTSLIIAFSFGSVSRVIKAKLMNLCEDEIKLTADYNHLLKYYSGSADEFIRYKNDYEKIKSDKIRKYLEKRNLDFSKEVSFPEIEVADLIDKKIVINDSEKMYGSPALIKENYDDLFGAHETSSIYNQLNIRVDSWYEKNGEFVMDTSRTTFYDSATTNRCMDYKWKNGLSVRDMYAYGPFVKPLSESELSNHLGFNGFIESSDGYIVFLKRLGDLSIGKRTYATSIGASLKTKYALKGKSEFTYEGLKNAILGEIEDEFKIKKEDLNGSEVNYSLKIISAYRDLVEGGKPQLCFHFWINKTKENLDKKFKEEINKNKKDNHLVIDGEETLWIHKSELKDLIILPDLFIYKDRIYRTMPSAAASIVMLIKCLKE